MALEYSSWQLSCKDSCMHVKVILVFCYILAFLPNHPHLIIFYIYNVYVGPVSPVKYEIMKTLLFSRKSTSHIFYRKLTWNKMYNYVFWSAHHKKENSQIQFYFIPISVQNRQRHKKQCTKTNINRKVCFYPNVQKLINVATNCRETFCQKKKVEYQTDQNSMCMSLYKSVNQTLFVYGFYKIGPLTDRFFLPIAVHNQYWEGTLQHTNIQIHKQENKQTNVSSDVISQNTIQDK